MEFQFQHIPRIENQLCDRLAARIIAHQEERDYGTAMQELEELHRMDKNTGQNEEEGSINSHNAANVASLPADKNAMTISEGIVLFVERHLSLL